jgi:hypothetical protein
LTHYLVAFSQVMNIQMTYLYRDAGNYKHWYDVVFPNESEKSAIELTEEIKKHLISGEYFEQELAPLPMDLDDDFDEELDHSWLEFHSFKDVDTPAQVDLDVMYFISRLDTGPK